jgi:hypothetical protein
MAQDFPASSTAKAADILPSLREHAGKAANKTVTSGAEAAQTVGQAAESAAQVLDNSLPMLAGYVRNAAHYTNELADQLRDKKAEELLSTAMRWCREQPLLTLAGATVLGFALARVAKTGIAASSAPATDSETTGSSSATTGSGMDSGPTSSWPTNSGQTGANGAANESR